MTQNILTQKELKELLHYNPETGIFTWIKIKGSSNRTIGCVAGHNNGNGYLSIMINGKTHKAHRLAWLYMTKKWPKDQIDHDNHIRHDNRWVNLFEATNQDNQKNSTKYKNNTSGVTGIGWVERLLKWRARISVNDRLVHLGVFTDKFEAICARKSANNKYGFHANHGN